MTYVLRLKGKTKGWIFSEGTLELYELGKGYYKLCMYPININKRPTEISYLSERGVDFNKELYALSEMIQFIWRGCIRQGQPMKVLVVSKRMRKLLEDWINE